MNDQDIYIGQLRELFDSYDVRETGHLDLEEITSLCKQLHLPEHTLSRLVKILKDKSDGPINFSLFKDSFIALLMQSTSGDLEEDAFDMDSEREISPKFTIGTKQYGRRSRPGSMIENDADNNSNEDEDSVVPSAADGNKDDDCFLENSIPSSPLHSTLQGQSESWGSPEAYLQGLWKKVGIEKNDSLNVRELACVCGHIGMDMSEDMVVQLFEKLDSDNDGRVTFDELLQCLFHHADVGKPAPETSFTCSPQNHGSYRHNSEEDMQLSEESWEAGIFSAIDPENTGYASVVAVVEFWESLGFSGSSRILQELGFNKTGAINLQNLSLVLEEELLSSCPDPTYQVALLTIQKEVRTLKARSLQLQAERDKLRAAIVEANERAALLAQEIDEHHTKLEASSQTQLIGLERKHQEQLRELQEENRREREVVASQTASLHQKLEDKLRETQESETNAQREVSILRQENVRLEKELAETSSRHDQSEQVAAALQKELDSLSEVRRQLVELQSSGGDTDQRCEGLKAEMEELRKQNKDLQDHVEEMSLQMESLKLHLASSRATPSSGGRQRHSRTSSWLADYNRACEGSNLKRRGSGSSSESNSEEEVVRSAGKMRRRFSTEGSIGTEKSEVFGRCFNGQIPEEMELDGKVEQQDTDTKQLLQISCFLREKGILPKEEAALAKAVYCMQEQSFQGVYSKQTDELLKELYVENSRLMRELQLAEDQHRRVEICDNKQYTGKVFQLQILRCVFSDWLPN